MHFPRLIPNQCHLPYPASIHLIFLYHLYCACLCNTWYKNMLCDNRFSENMSFCVLYSHQHSKKTSGKLCKQHYSGRTKYSAFVSKLSNLSGEYLCPQKTQKAVVFFYSKDLRLESELKFFNRCKNTLKFLHKMSLNWHTKKNYILRGKMPTKSLKKIILRKKNWGDSSLGYNKLIVR